MLEIIEKLLSPEYLIVSEPGPVGGAWPLYASLALLFLAGLVAAAWALVHLRGQARRPQEEGRQAVVERAYRGVEGEQTATPSGRGWAWIEIWVCLVGLGTVVGRFLNWPGWSARIWPYSLAVLTIGGWLAYWARGRELPASLGNQLRILALAEPGRLEDWKDGKMRPSGPPIFHSSNLPFFHPSMLLGLAVHLVGVTLVATARFGWPIWTGPLLLVALLAPQWPLVARREAPRLMALTPLLAAYGVTLLWLAYQALGITVIGWQGQVFPNPLVSLFYVDGIVLAAVAYTTLCQINVTLRAFGKPAAVWRWALAGLLVVTLAWAAGVYFGKRTHGVTATDPYAYAQMAVDLAQRGTFLHRFPLFQQVIPLKIAWAPLQPLGYHIPRNDLGDCPSVWATGASVLLAGGYWLLGEPGLYVTTPIVALLAALATWALALEALHGQPRPVRYATGTLAAVLLATSPEYVDRLLVPMADAPAALFTVLALWFMLRLMRYLEESAALAQVLGRLPWRRVAVAAALGGACFAWAYWVRHTQITLAIPAIAAVAVGTRKRRPASEERSGRRALVIGVWSLVIFFGVALIAAVPDIIYRWQVFGGPLRTETTELPLMGLQHIGVVAWQMLRDALVAGEWGYLFPLALYGAYRLARARGRAALVLGAGLMAVLLVHLTYRSLRLRDLISLFPLVDLAVAYGAVTVARWARSTARRAGTRPGPALLAAAAVAWVILSLGMARWAMIDNLWKPGWASFGYMRAEHRAAFDRLATLTPDNAIVGTSLNSGAVMMYSGRDAIRPYDSWTDGEWQVFLHTMQALGRPVYLLDDGGLMAEFIDKERATYRLTPIEALEVPLFYTQDRETGWLYRLEWDR